MRCCLWLRDGCHVPTTVCHRSIADMALAFDPGPGAASSKLRLLPTQVTCIENCTRRSQATAFLTPVPATSGTRVNVSIAVRKKPGRMCYFVGVAAERFGADAGQQEVRRSAWSLENLAGGLHAPGQPNEGKALPCFHQVCPCGVSVTAAVAVSVAVVVATAELWPLVCRSRCAGDGCVCCCGCPCPCPCPCDAGEPVTCRLRDHEAPSAQADAACPRASGTTPAGTLFQGRFMCLQTRPRFSGDRTLYRGGGGSEAKKKFVYLKSTSNLGPL